LQGPPGQEKLRFALTFLAEGLKTGACGLIVISSHSPDSVLEELRNLGVNFEAVTKENRLRIVDWYSWSEEPVQDVEERGLVLRSSIDLTNLGVALSRAIVGLAEPGPRRAVLEILSPATNVYEVTQVYAFAQSAKRKFDRHRFTPHPPREGNASIRGANDPPSAVRRADRNRAGSERGRDYPQDWRAPSQGHRGRPVLPDPRADRRRIEGGSRIPEALAFRVSDAWLRPRITGRASQSAPAHHANSQRAPQNELAGCGRFVRPRGRGGDAR